MFHQLPFFKSYLTTFFFGFVLLLSGLGSSDLRAEALASPAGKVILKVDGAIGKTNSENQAQFDLAMLEALPVTTYNTGTPFTEGVDTFTGVLFRDLLVLLNHTGTDVKMTALNDYSVSGSLEQLVALDALIAYKWNGDYMTARNKGPLWVVFPWSQKTDVNWYGLENLSIWSLSDLKIE